MEPFHGTPNKKHCGPHISMHVRWANQSAARQRACPSSSYIERRRCPCRPHAACRPTAVLTVLLRVYTRLARMDALDRARTAARDRYTTAVVRWHDRGTRRDRVLARTVKRHGGDLWPIWWPRGTCLLECFWNVVRANVILKFRVYFKYYLELKPFYWAPYRSCGPHEIRG